MKKLLSLLFMVFISANVFAGDDDVLVTRDGAFTPVKIVRISTLEVTYVDLSKKKRQRTVPTSSVYMIMKEKGNNIFFDEEGNQMTSPAIKIDKKDIVMFTNDGKIYPVYEVSFGKNTVSFKLQDKKKAPTETMDKSEIFLIRNSDGTSTIFSKQKASADAPQSIQIQTTPTTKYIYQSVSQNKPAQISQIANGTIIAQDLIEKNAQMIAEFNARPIPYDEDKDKGKQYGGGGNLILKYAFSPNSVLETEDISVKYNIVRYYTNRLGGDKITDVRDEADKRKGQGWKGGQGIGVSLTNKSNRVIFIDLGNSYMSMAGESTPYYVPSATSVSKSTSTGVGINMGAVAGVLGVSGSLGTLASGVNVGGGNTTETTHITYSQRVISIPPHSTFKLENRPITRKFGTEMRQFYLNYFYHEQHREFDKSASYGYMPAINYGEIFDLQLGSTPLISTFITYGFDESVQQTQNIAADLYFSQMLINEKGFDPYSMPMYYQGNAQGYLKKEIKEVTGE